MQRFLVLLRTWIAPSALSLNIFFIGKFLIQQSAYNDKVDQIISRLDRLDERNTNFMGYYEECKANQRDRDVKQEEMLKSNKQDLDRFYSEYLPFVKFDYKRK